MLSIAIYIIEEDFENLKALYLEFLRLKDITDSDFEIHVIDHQTLSSGLSEHQYLLVSSLYFEQHNIDIPDVFKHNLILAADEDTFFNNHLFEHRSFIHIIPLNAGLKDIYMLLLQIQRMKEILRSSEVVAVDSLFLKGSVLYNKKSNGSSWVSNASDIVFIEAEGDLCILHYLDHNNKEAKKQTLQKSISYIELVCNQVLFFRIHRKYLVNLLHILDYGEYPDTTVILQFQGHNIELPLSRRRKLEFHNHFKKVRQLRNVVDDPKA